MPSFVNNVTTTNKNTEKTICLGGKKAHEKVTIFPDISTTVCIFTQKRVVAELTQRWITLGFKSIFWLC